MFRRAAVLLPAVAVSLRLRGFAKTREALQAKLDRVLPWEGDAKSEAELVERACRMVKAASRYGAIRATCLEESLTLWYLVKKQGVAVSLRIGVRKVQDKLEAHAWVEHGGVALGQAEELHRHYAAFDDKLLESSGEKR